MHTRIRTPFFLLCLVLLGGQVWGQDCVEYDYTRWIGEAAISGPISDLAITGQTAFLAAGDFGFAVVDLTDPENPSFQSFVDTPDSCTIVRVSENRLFVGDYGSLRIYDITILHSPQFLGDVAFPNPVEAMEVKEQVAYLGIGWGGFRIVDATDPSNPITTNPGSMPCGALGLGNNLLLHFMDNIAKDSNFAQIVQVFSVGDPSSLIYLGQFFVDERPSRVRIIGSYAYLFMGPNGVQIWDIFNPTAPALAAILPTPGEAHDLVVGAEFSVLADGSAGVHLLDMIDPANPVIKGNLAMPSDAVLVSSLDGNIVACHRNSGLLMGRIPDPIQPIGSTPVIGASLAVEGDLAYVGGGAGIEIVDISDPANPVLLNSFYAYTGGRLTVKYGYAYCCDGTTILVCDVSDPNQPTYVSRMGDEIYTDVAYRAGYLYATSRSNGKLEAFRISDPANPEKVFETNLSWWANSVQAAGEYLYVAENYTVRIFDLVNPANPNLITTILLPGGASTMALTLQYYMERVYVATNENVVYIYDIQDKLNPIFLGSYQLPAYPLEIACLGEYVYVATHSSSGDGLFIIDFSNPTLPGLKGHDERECHDVVVAGGYLCTTGDSKFTMALPQCYTIPSSVLVDGVPEVKGLAATCIPNPFNPRATIKFNLVAQGAVSLDVFDMAGRRVRALMSKENRPSGINQVVWDGRDDLGRNAPSGNYLYRLQFGANQATGKMVLLR